MVESWTGLRKPSPKNPSCFSGLNPLNILNIPLKPRKLIKKFNLKVRSAIRKTFFFFYYSREIDNRFILYLRFYLTLKIKTNGHLDSPTRSSNNFSYDFNLYTSKLCFWFKLRFIFWSSYFSQTNKHKIVLAWIFVLPRSSLGQDETKRHKID